MDRTSFVPGLAGQSARYSPFTHYTEKNMSRCLGTIVLAGAMLLLSGCGYNTLQSTDEQIKASWAEVVNQYQDRKSTRLNSSHMSESRMPSSA